jgi:enamine deaminase RidA (YjgF/YER057c/UK114 family)
MADYSRVDAKRPWAPLIGYSRAVRRGPLIEVGGTSATAPGGEVLFPGDPYEQTRHIIGVINEALAELGATPSDVVRTRAFLTNVDHWQEVGRAHGEVFGDIQPASSFVEVSRLLLPGLVVEIEATALLSGGW